MDDSRTTTRRNVCPFDNFGWNEPPAAARGSSDTIDFVPHPSCVTPRRTSPLLAADYNCANRRNRNRNREANRGDKPFVTW